MLTKDFLNYLRYDKVEGVSFEYDDETYPVPYQSISLNGEYFQGLRDINSRIRIIDKYIGDIKKDNYLEVGANMGQFANYYSTIFTNVNAIDADPYYTQLCSMLYNRENLKFHNKSLAGANVLKMFPDTKFDLILLMSVLEYIPNKEIFLMTLYEMMAENSVLIVEGHSMDINSGLDRVYEKMLKNLPWKAKRYKDLTDAGLNAPRESKGRPLWICHKP